jgi:hypothetical protein
MHVVRSVAAWLGVGVLLCCWTLACGPAASPAASPTAGDPFAVIRATSQAAYATGEAYLDRGDYLQACVELDLAKTTDPDNRPDIDQALRQALEHCLTPAAEATSAPGQPLPTLALPTLPAGAAAVTPTPPAVTPTSPVAAVTPAQGAPGAPAGTAVVAQPTSVGPSSAAGTAQATAAAATKPDQTATPVAKPAASDLVTWTDPQGRFSLGAPADWITAPQPQSLFGTSVVEFVDPSGRAEVDVAVDTNTKAVSPELYAASMELAMQQQVPGYASEQVVPGTTAGSPSVRRVFTFTERDANGQDHQARGFQVTIIKGSTPYIVSGSSPAEQFQQFSPSFDRMVESFRFS